LKTIQIFTLAVLMYLIVSLTITIGMRFLDRATVRGMARGRGG
jgi:polar amino acid transport system permease protein